MREDKRKPREVVGAASVWLRKLVGGRYCAFTDTSHGVGADYFVTCIMDVASGNVVADVFSNVIPAEEGAAQSAALLAKYDNPLWAIEDNEWGALTLAAAKRIGYPNLYHRENDAKKPEGWHTDEKNRHVLWGELQEAVKAGHLRVWNEAGLAQFYDVIRNVDKGGRAEAISGGHDDYPFAVGGCWQMRIVAGGSGGPIVQLPRSW